MIILPVYIFKYDKLLDFSFIDWKKNTRYF